MAMPGMLLQLAKASPMMGQIKQMYRAVQTAQNPQLMLNQLMNSNPLMKQANEVINQYGGDIGKALDAKASELGITAQDVMEFLK